MLDRHWTWISECLVAGGDRGEKLGTLSRRIFGSRPLTWPPSHQPRPITTNRHGHRHLHNHGQIAAEHLSHFHCPHGEVFPVFTWDSIWVVNWVAVAVVLFSTLLTIQTGQLEMRRSLFLAFQKLEKNSSIIDQKVSTQHKLQTILRIKNHFTLSIRIWIEESSLAYWLRIRMYLLENISNNFYVKIWTMTIVFWCSDP